MLRKASIVINCFNYGSLLSRAIESALSQNYPADALEVIVVDDGSTDNSAAVCLQYASQGVRYHLQQNSGQAVAINTGMRIATGDVICLLDADDYFYPDKVTVVMDCFRANSEIGAVFNNYDCIDSNGRYREWTKFLPDQHKLRAYSMFGRAAGIQTTGITLKRDVAKTFSIPKSMRLCADTYLLLVLPQLTTVSLLRVPLHAYSLHGNNLFQDASYADKIHVLQEAKRAIFSAATADPRLSFYPGYWGLREYLLNGNVRGAAMVLCESLMFLGRHSPSLRFTAREIAKLMLSPFRR